MLLAFTCAARPLHAQATQSINPELNDLLRAGTVFIETKMTLSGRNWSQMPPELRERLGRMPSTSASGSGFLVSPEGHIITNAHVIDDVNFIVRVTKQGVESKPADRATYLPLDPLKPEQPFTLAFTVSNVKVVLFSGEDDELERPPKILKVDRKTDLALLKISFNEELPYLDLGSDNDAQSGAAVVMTGFPGGATPDIAPFVNRGNADRLSKRNPRASVNTGLITSIRQYGSQKRYQLDIRANHGNSGGPITDFEGRVLGVLYSGIDQMQSISYAIPVSHVLKMLPSGVADGLGEGSDGAGEPAEGEEEKPPPFSSSEGFIEVKKPKAK